MSSDKNYARVISVLKVDTFWHFSVLKVDNWRRLVLKRF